MLCLCQNLKLHQWTALSGQLVWQRGKLITNNNQWTDFPTSVIGPLWHLLYTILPNNIQVDSSLLLSIAIWHAVQDRHEVTDNRHFLHLASSFARQWRLHRRSHHQNPDLLHLSGKFLVFGSWSHHHSTVSGTLSEEIAQSNHYQHLR